MRISSMQSEAARRAARKHGKLAPLKLRSSATSAHRPRMRACSSQQRFADRNRAAGQRGRQPTCGGGHLFCEGTIGPQSFASSMSYTMIRVWPPLGVSEFGEECVRMRPLLNLIRGAGAADVRARSRYVFHVRRPRARQLVCHRGIGCDSYLISFSRQDTSSLLRGKRRA